MEPTRKRNYSEQVDSSKSQRIDPPPTPAYTKEQVVELVCQGKFGIIDYLRGFQIDLRDYLRGTKIMHRAVAEDKVYVIAMLILLKFDVNEKDELGLTPLQVAKHLDHSNSIEYLLAQSEAFQPEEESWHIAPFQSPINEEMSYQNVKNVLEKLIEFFPHQCFIRDNENSLLVLPTIRRLRNLDDTLKCQCHTQAARNMNLDIFLMNIILGPFSSSYVRLDQRFYSGIPKNKNKEYQISFVHAYEKQTLFQQVNTCNPVGLYCFLKIHHLTIEEALVQERASLLKDYNPRYELLIHKDFKKKEFPFSWSKSDFELVSTEQLFELLANHDTISLYENEPSYKQALEAVASRVNNRDQHGFSAMDYVNAVRTLNWKGSGLFAAQIFREAPHYINQWVKEGIIQSDFLCYQEGLIDLKETLKKLRENRNYLFLKFQDTVVDYVKNDNFVGFGLVSCIFGGVFMIRHEEKVKTVRHIAFKMNLERLKELFNNIYDNDDDLFDVVAGWEGGDDWDTKQNIIQDFIALGGISDLNRKKRGQDLLKYSIERVLNYEFVGRENIPLALLDAGIEIPESIWHTMLKLPEQEMDEFKQVFDKLSTQALCPRFINYQDPETGNTPVHAILSEYKYGNDEKSRKYWMEFFISKGANLNLQNAQGRTPLHLIAVDDDPELSYAELLLENGADPHITDLEGKTPLHLHLEKCDSDADGDAQKFITEEGADVNIPDNDGNTPLKIAAERGMEENVKILLKAGANPFIPNCEGKLPIDYADAQEVQIIARLKKAMQKSRLIKLV